MRTEACYPPLHETRRYGCQRKRAMKIYVSNLSVPWSDDTRLLAIACHVKAVMRLLKDYAKKAMAMVFEGRVSL